MQPQVICTAAREMRGVLLSMVYLYSCVLAFAVPSMVPQKSTEEAEHRLSHLKQAVNMMLKFG